MTFADLGLSTWIVGQCQALGLSKPTEIQRACIPKIVEGGDCIGCAKTGSGKTLTFALPILEKLSKDPYGIYALVLTPTRELAFQIGDQFSAIGKAIGLKKCVVVGGMDMVAQGSELAKHPHIVVATPGRLADHLESCDTFTLSRIQFLVLDEADRLLAGGFDQQLAVVFAALPRQKQVLLFSATMTDALDKVRHVTSGKVFSWESKDTSGIATVKELNQYYVLCPADVRDSFLVETIRRFRSRNDDGLIMVFTDTCKNCQLLSVTLNQIGFKNVALHAMMKQRERLAALVKFKSNQARILIATDVASRGLDIPMVELVINHIVPNVPKEYIHRVGRTARAGRDGMAISLVAPHDIKLLHSIEETIGIRMTQFDIDDAEVLTFLTQVSVAKREAEMQLDETDFYEKKMINKEKKLLLEGTDLDEVAESKKRMRKGVTTDERKDRKKVRKERRLYETTSRRKDI